MSRWVLKGLGTGRVTTDYPKKKDMSPGITPGIPVKELDKRIDKNILSLCPTSAIFIKGDMSYVATHRCIHCFRCIRSGGDSVPWNMDYEWANATHKDFSLPSSFKHSAHIRVVDAGDCGACINEVKLLNNPYYNMHRLGLFITPTPRKADILLVVGCVTEHMKIPLKKAYEAMPTPKRVIAVGSCALSGGIFEPDFMTYSSVSEVIPVDVEVPGCPPPPIAILHALMMVCNQNNGLIK